MGRGNQVHTRFKLESRGNQVRKAIKMLQSTTARTGNLCGNKTTFGGTLPVGSVKHFLALPSDRAALTKHIHRAKGCRSWVCHCHQGCPGEGSSPGSGRLGWRGQQCPLRCHTGHTPSPALSQPSCQHCTSPASALGTGNCPV